MHHFIHIHIPNTDTSIEHLVYHSNNNNNITNSTLLLTYYHLFCKLARFLFRIIMKNFDCLPFLLPLLLQSLPFFSISLAFNHFFFSFVLLILIIHDHTQLRIHSFKCSPSFFILYRIAHDEN